MTEMTPWQKRKARMTPEQIKARREYSREFARAKRAADPEAARAAGRASMEKWRKANPEEDRRKAAAWRAANPEKARALGKAWRAANPERARELDRRNHYKRSYGIEPEQYDIMLAEQGGVCFICKKPPGRVKLHLDHCHKTSAVRRILCARCNTLVAVVENERERLAAVQAYVASYGGTS